MSQRGFVPVYLLIGALILLASAALFLFKNNFSKANPNENLPNIQKLNEESKKISVALVERSRWKIYSNEKYNFQLTYPVRGVIHSSDEYLEGDCGKAIKESKNGETTAILIDNLLELQIFPWEGSVDDYLVQKGAKNQYDLENIEGSGATEAVKILGLKKGAEYAVGYPPLIYIRSIYKQGDNLIIFKTIPFHPNSGSCIDPHLVDPVKYAKYLNQGWDMDKSLKFL